jgi:hypothetical protein
MKSDIAKLEERCFRPGSVKDGPRSGRRKTRLTTCAAASVPVDRFPENSTQKRSAECDVPRATIWRQKKKDWNLKPYRRNSQIDAVIHVVHSWKFSRIQEPARKFPSPMSAQFTLCKCVFWMILISSSCVFSILISWLSCLSVSILETNLHIFSHLCC